MRTRWLTGGMLLAVASTWFAAGCARQEMVVDLYGSVVYEKPRIRQVSHTLTDGRREGGAAVVHVYLLGDPGLSASFDIYPGIVEHRPMTETEAGSYAGEFTFPADDVGGAFTVTGRLEHPEAGTAILRDPVPLSIARIDGR